VAGPSCSCCYDVEFDDRIARREALEYRRRGPRPATRALADALADGSASGLTVLEVGGGIGALHHLLLQRGAARAVDVDASRPYLAAARAEAERLGLADRVAFVHGDFVTLAPTIEPADLVGLDRVACCYPDGEALVGAAAAHARRRLALVLPPDGRLARLGAGAINVWQRLLRSSLRMHAHRHAAIAAAARAAGLEWTATRPVGGLGPLKVWRLLVFERPHDAPVPVLASDAQVGG
jgi:magnesium-protoporphyrin O-methyltransferase